jgi:ParB family chromosome partitioning protein
VEELVRNLIEERQNGLEKKKEEPPKDYEALKNHLRIHFNSKVEFKRNNNGSGKIVIPFKTDEDLERIIAIFDKLNT